MASVTFEHVTKRFGNVVAVNDLSMEITDKEFLVIVGPSGSGKSVSLRMLAGLEEITEGLIYIGERVVNNVAPKDRDVAMVFQSYALYPHMTVYDNMAFGLRLRKTPKRIIEERVHQAARSLSIEDLLDRRPRQLSGGQRQRVAVGRAIVREPAVFLMDEPLSNLDAKLRVEARAFLGKLHKSLETTFVYVTHDQTEAMTLGSRIAVLNNGMLQQLDTPYNLYQHPCNLFVAGFIGSPAMNFIDVNLKRDGSRLWIETKGFSFSLPTSMTKQYQNYLGKKLTLGIRPEDIHSAEFQPPDVTPMLIQTQVDSIEQMGHELVLFLDVGGQLLTARTDPRTPAYIGHLLDVAINMDNIYLFDAETEESLDYLHSSQEEKNLSPAIELVSTVAEH
jgi:multiple sugar transport system ATP-binding protein